jgi:hypothetical protein
MVLCVVVLCGVVVVYLEEDVTRGYSCYIAAI